MEPLKGLKRPLEENDILQELAELETRLSATEEPSTSADLERRAFDEVLAKMLRERLQVIRTVGKSREATSTSRQEPERRRAPRLQTDLTAKIISQDQRQGPARVLNVSRGGVAVSFSGSTLRTVFPNNQVLPGSIVSVRFPVQDSPSTSHTVKLTGVVVWVQQVHEDEYRLGLRWTES